MVTICQQCGDKGWSVALIYCVKCLNFAVHRYCLPKIPETFDEFVNWACDDCERIKMLKKRSLPQNPNSIPLNEGDNKSPGHVDLVHCETKSNKKRKAMCLDAEKIDEKIQEPLSPSQSPEAPSTPIESEVKNTDDSIVSETKANENKTSQEPKKAKKKPKKKRTSLTCRKQKRRRVVVSSVAKKQEEREEEHPEEDPTDDAELASDSSQMEVVPVGECQLSNEIAPSVPLCIEKSVEEPYLEKERRLVVFNGGSEVSRVDNGENYVPLNYLGPAKPVIDSIWRGNFSTSNKKYDMENGFVAHLSNKACPKVWEEAKLFPHSLCLEMLPKADVWPKSFQHSQPSDDNIALYFFPADKSNERVFDQLVEELMRREIGMKTTVQNAELLIFASMELPVPHWRFKGKYYLWGVFRGKQQTKLGEARSPLSPLSNNGDQEMEDSDKSEKSCGV